MDFQEKLTMMFPQFPMELIGEAVSMVVETVMDDQEVARMAILGEWELSFIREIAESVMCRDMTRKLDAIAGLVSLEVRSRVDPDDVTQYFGVCWLYNAFCQMGLVQE